MPDKCPLCGTEPRTFKQDFDSEVYQVDCVSCGLYWIEGDTRDDIEMTVGNKRYCYRILLVDYRMSDTQLSWREKS